MTPVIPTAMYVAKATMKDGSTEWSSAMRGDSCSSSNVTRDTAEEIGVFGMELTVDLRDVATIAVYQLPDQPIAEFSP